MKTMIRMLCLLLPLTLLLAGCIAAPRNGGPEDRSIHTENDSAPAGSTTAPVESTAAPAGSTTAPVESSAAPAGSTTAPVESTAAPVESTAAPVESTAAPVESTAAPDTTTGMYLLVNGARIAPGMRYADVREALGAQTAPDQELGSCDDPTFVRTVHFYPNLTVTENPDGVIWGIELSSMYAGTGDAALLGTVGLGATLDEALAALGAPENAGRAKEDRVLIYRQDGLEICVFLDAESGETVSGVSMTLS